MNYGRNRPKNSVFIETPAASAVRPHLFRMRKRLIIGIDISRMQFVQPARIVSSNSILTAVKRELSFGNVRDARQFNRTDCN